MRTSVGLWDAFFGERVELHLPTPTGERKVKVTRRWLEQMEAEGRIKPTDKHAVTAYIVGVAEPREVESWVVGEDVTAEDYDRFRDPASNALYAIRYFRDGDIVQQIVTKEIWEKAKAEMDKMG